MKSYFRPEIDAIAGYTPGEQPKMADLVKLNTNENPYPPSPKVAETLRTLDWEKLRRYPDPCADALRQAIADREGRRLDEVIIGNGSDDLLTMIFRSFTAPDRPVAVFEPSYSLYPVLAAMQGAPVIRLPLDSEPVAYPAELPPAAAAANLLIITRPNAPTGNSVPRERAAAWCAAFDGIVLIDEAYCDFAEDNCADFAVQYPNVIVMRTFSKGSSLAGIRAAYALAAAPLVAGLMKLKDSYNSDAVAQAVALAAYSDLAYKNSCLERIRSERTREAAELRKLGFKVIPSEANFLFVSPPDGDAAGVFAYLRQAAVIVRYFPGPVTGSYLRITIGTPAENEALLRQLRRKYGK